MTRYCSVNGCEAKGGFKFPSDANKRKRWLDALSQKNLNPKYVHTCVVCAKHFKQTDIYNKDTNFYTGQPVIRRRLLSHAVPSIALNPDYVIKRIQSRAAPSVASNSDKPSLVHTYLHNKVQGVRLESLNSDEHYIASKPMSLDTVPSITSNSDEQCSENTKHNTRSSTEAANLVEVDRVCKSVPTVPSVVSNSDEQCIASKPMSLATVPSVTSNSDKQCSKNTEQNTGVSAEAANLVKVDRVCESVQTVPSVASNSDEPCTESTEHNTRLNSEVGNPIKVECPVYKSVQIQDCDDKSALKSVVRYGRYCCVKGCTSKYRKTDDIRYYKFPTSTFAWRNVRRQEWVQAVIKHNKFNDDWQPKKSTVICSVHFAGGAKSEHPQHPGYNPTIFSGQSTKKGEKMVARFKRRLQREQSKIAASKLPATTAALASTSKLIQNVKAEPIPLQQPQFIKVENNYIDNEDDDTPKNKKSKINNSECHMDLSNKKSLSKIVVGNQKVPISKIVVCNQKVPPRKIEVSNQKVPLRKLVVCNQKVPLSKIVVFNQKVENNQNCATTQVKLQNVNNNGQTLKTEIAPQRIITGSLPPIQPVRFNGISSIHFNYELIDMCGVTFEVFNVLLKTLPEMMRISISNANRLLIFLMKLKQGLTCSSLAILFNTPREVIDRIFNETLESLTKSTMTIVNWPNKEAIQNVLPESFKATYSNCRAIIDCTEIEIETPVNIEERLKFDFTYKNAHSFKLFIACASNGFVSYKSKCYGGQKSNELVASDCGFLDLIDSGDVILSDKEFPSIKTAIENKKAIFVTPPFTENPELTSVHAHVLHCIHQIKFFKILSCVPVDLISKVDDIVQVCCALNNLRNPLKKTE